MPKSRKSEIIARLSHALRRHSGVTVMFHAAVAERVGLGQADHKCLDLLIQEGPKSAGELAAHTGLTTGAITGVIDRLERAGYASRRPDPEDRRKVIVVPNMEAAFRDLGPIFAGIGQATDELLQRYSIEELNLILDFIQRADSMVEEQARRLAIGEGP